MPGPLLRTTMPSNPEGAGRHISQIETLWPVLHQAHAGSAPEANAAQQAVLQRYRPGPPGGRGIVRRGVVAHDPTTQAPFTSPA